MPISTPSRNKVNPKTTSAAPIKNLISVSAGMGETVKLINNTAIATGITEKDTSLNLERITFKTDILSNIKFYCRI
jgi:hypothetical protein